MALSRAGSASRERSPVFATTAWNLVLRARSNEHERELAFGELCAAYWYPVYAFARRSGLIAADAEDATQSFFAWLLEGNALDHADPARGRFRSFLITAFRQFLSRRREYESAAKRCPERPILSLHLEQGEPRYKREPCHDQTPERMFEYAWALSIIERAMSALRREWEQSGKGERFEALKSTLNGSEPEKHRDLARQLNISEGAVRVTIHRLRNRFGQLLRAEIGQTLESERDIEEELQQMMAALKL